MKNNCVITHDANETILLGEQLAKHLTPGDIVCLNGELGSGKTTLVKGIARGLRIAKSKVKSPTFVLMNIYQGKKPLYHFDLYRIDGNLQLATIGFEEFLYGEGVSVIEWADQLGEFMPREYLGVHLSHRKSGGRTIRFKAQGQRYRDKIRAV